METQNERIAMIRNDREHGSRWLVRETISLLYDIAREPVSSPEERLQQLRQAGDELASARPAMAALAGAVRRILNAPGGLEGMISEASKLLSELDSAIEQYYRLCQTISHRNNHDPQPFRNCVRSTHKLYFTD